MGSLPYEPHPRDDTKGATPPLESPASPPLVPYFLRELPGLHFKNHASTRTPRNIHLFNRAAAEASSIDPL